jgi:1-acyl-sn-glycerol-3-phosphate acyltransferase
MGRSGGRRLFWPRRNTLIIPFSSTSCPALDKFRCDVAAQRLPARPSSRRARLLGRGWSIAIYPEGTRSRDGKLHKGNTGAARIAHQAHVPLVPVGLRGTEAVQAPGQTLPRPFKPVTIRFGPPIEPPINHTPSRLREVTDTVVASIGALCNQEYCDEYAIRPTAAAGTRTPRLRAWRWQPSMTRSGRGSNV